VLVGLLALKEAFFKEEAAPIAKWCWVFGFLRGGGLCTYWHFGTLQFFTMPRAATLW